MLALLLAASSALIWGAGDFCGGKATQRSRAALPVTVVSQVAGLPVLALGVLLISAPSPQPSDVGWGALAGMAGFVGIVLLYRGLAAGAMAIFAPITAVAAAVVPLGVGLVLDDPPGTLALVGVCCAIIAIALMSLQVAGSGRHAVVTPRLILLALSAGTMFGVFFTLLGRAGDNAGMWPVLGVRVGSLTLGLLLVARQRVSLRLDRPVLRLTVTAGVFDITANALYLLAAQRGLLSVVAPIAALYPASTVLLALLVDRERLRPIQLAGLGLAATALVLVAT